MSDRLHIVHLVVLLLAGLSASALLLIPAYEPVNGWLWMLWGPVSVLPAVLATWLALEPIVRDRRQRALDNER